MQQQQQQQQQRQQQPSEGDSTSPIPSLLPSPSPRIVVAFSGWNQEQVQELRTLCLRELGLVLASEGEEWGGEGGGQGGVTHVVMRCERHGNTLVPRRTPAYLDALLRGVAVVDVNWLWDSLESLDQTGDPAASLQSSDEYLVSDAVLAVRRQREEGREGFLAEYAVVFQGDFQLVPDFSRSTLARLVELVGATVVMPHQRGRQQQQQQQQQHVGRKTKLLVVEVEGTEEPFDWRGLDDVYQSLVPTARRISVESLIGSLAELELRG
eukprot:evm.model.NODE_6063_length_10767_cov_19.432432.3